MDLHLSSSRGEKRWMNSSMTVFLMLFLGLFFGLETGAGPQRPIPCDDSISGTWVLQQVSSQEELTRLVPRTISPALGTSHIRGFCLRVPWKAVDRDFSLLEAGLKIARRHGVEYSIRFMAGRHTPARVFESGARFYRVRAGKHARASRPERVPAPFLANGAPNRVFEAEYEKFVKRLASWCREHDVHLMHLAWYGQDWAELNHGKEVRSLPGYSFDNWLQAHLRLLDIGLKHADDDLAVELPFSGYGPLTDAAVRLADHVVAQVGPYSPRFYCQANGWAPGGDWGAPAPEIEAEFDRVWQRPICRGLQAIQPSDFNWSQMYEKLSQNGATYCEVYAPSFLGAHRRELAEEIRRFAEHCRETTREPDPASATLHRLDADSPEGLRRLFRYDGERIPVVSAHRGGALAGYPENCIGTFEHTLQHTFSILEVDLRRSKDGRIVLHHDATLERTTTGTGRVADRTLPELKELRLKDKYGRVTDFRMPTLDQALEWARGKTILILDKKDVPVEVCVEKIEEHGAVAYAMIMAYSFQDIQKCHSLNQEVMMEAMIGNRRRFRAFDETRVPWSRIVAFVGHEPPKDRGLIEMIHAKGASCMAGTSRNLDGRIPGADEPELASLKARYRSRLDLGIDLIETDYPAQVGVLLYPDPMIPESKSRYFHPPAASDSSQETEGEERP